MLECRAILALFFYIYFCVRRTSKENQILCNKLIKAFVRLINIKKNNSMCNMHLLLNALGTQKYTKTPHGCCQAVISSAIKATPKLFQWLFTLSAGLLNFWKLFSFYKIRVQILGSLRIGKKLRSLPFFTCRWNYFVKK